jgi:hypothetical protein
MRRPSLSLIALTYLVFSGAVLAQGTPAPREEPPLPPKVQVPPSEEDAPTVNIRRDDSTGDVVEEYRQNGRLYLVKVTPRKGPSYQLLDTNGDGKLDRADHEGGVRPVYWTLYEWN